MTHRQTTQMLLGALHAVVGLSVFVFDIALPLSGSACMLYMALAGIAMRLMPRETTLRLVYGYTALILLGLLCARSDQALWVDIINRTFAFGGLWAIVWCAFYRQDHPEVIQDAGEEGAAAVYVSGDMAAHEASLRQQRDWLDGTLASLGEAVITTDAHLTITFFNRAAEDLTGWQAIDACGRPLTMVLRLCDAATRKPVTVSLDHVLQEGIATELAEQLRLLRPDGQSRAIAGRGTPLLDAQGQVQGVVLVIRDLTAPKRLEAQMRQSQKLAAIGTLAGGIAHEFNNLLAGIMGFTELALEDTPDDSVIRPHLQKVMKASLRAKQVVLQLLTFSRQTPPVREPVQLDTIIHDALTLLRASLPSAITIHYHETPHNEAILADPAQLHQVVMHLAANAGDAMRDHGGRLEINADTIKIPTDSGTSPELPPGAYARLRVRDTGCGMPPEIQERIFEPFFTTKEVGQGTGLGLATVHGIVTGYGGAITVASRVGRGTTFTVYLPLSTETRAVSVPTMAPLTQEHGCVLVVDDEPMLVQVSCARLGRLGYETVGCTESQDALRVFRATPERFTLVLTDYTMPEMTGLKLARTLQHIRPDIPVILSSGAQEGLDTSRVLGQGIAAVLLKPWSMQELTTTLQRLQASTPAPRPAFCPGPHTAGSGCAPGSHSVRLIAGGVVPRPGVAVVNGDRQAEWLSDHGVCG